MKIITLALVVFGTNFLPNQANAEALRSPGEIIKSAPSSDWRSLDPNNTLYIELETGRVIVELNPLLAPKHSQQMRMLANENFYQGLNFYRYVEGFVAQAGDKLEQRKIKTAASSLQSERYHTSAKPLPVTYLPTGDGYAQSTGFLNGFAVASDVKNSQYWQTHCQGAFAMARSEDPDSGSSEFYIVIGQAPRYLDKNLTVFGQVRQGMEFIHTLTRRPVTNKAGGQMDNKIKTIQLASQIDENQRTSLSVLRTDSSSFKQLIKSRMNRPNAFFIERPNYIDVCGITVPVK